jgi:hypothetical protein
MFFYFVLYHVQGVISIIYDMNMAIMAVAFTGLRRHPDVLSHTVAIWGRHIAVWARHIVKWAGHV